MSGLNKEVILNSDLSEMVKVEAIIDEVNDVGTLSDEKYPNLLIAVTEAFNNAVMHGNNFDVNKSVNIKVKAEDSGVVVRIQDNGDGFDYDNLPDPTDPINIEKFNGRGVFLMNNLADSVEFNKEGNEVTLKFLP
jgi:serine/threonine-protein kinase RsbW